MVLRLAIAALLLGAFSQEPSIPRLVEQLASEDIETREHATEQLGRLGKTARPALLEALRSKDPEVALRAREILRRTDPLQLIRGFASPLSHGFSPLPLTLQLGNEDSRERIFCGRHLELGVWLIEAYEDLDLGPEPEPMWVSPGDACLLSEVDFLTLRPNETVDYRYADILGWNAIPSTEVSRLFGGSSTYTVGFPGRYRIVASYQHDREAYKRRCNRGCEGHDDPSRPWNRSFEASYFTSDEFVIQPQRRW